MFIQHDRSPLTFHTKKNYLKHDLNFNDVWEKSCVCVKEVELVWWWCMHAHV